MKIPVYTFAEEQVPETSTKVGVFRWVNTVPQRMRQCFYNAANKLFNEGGFNKAKFWLAKMIAHIVRCNCLKETKKVKSGYSFRCKSLSNFRYDCLKCAEYYSLAVGPSDFSPAFGPGGVVLEPEPKKLMQRKPIWDV